MRSFLSIMSTHPRRPRHPRAQRRAGVVALFALVLVAPLAASAQRPPAPTKPGPAKPGTEAAGPVAPHVEEPALAIVANGLTSEQAATRAVKLSYLAKVSAANAAVAGSRAEQARIDYVPTFTLLGKYTRYSTVTPPRGTTQGVETLAAPGTVNPPTFATEPTSFPVVLDQFFLQASVTVPLSDYFLKTNRALSAAMNAEDAARFDMVRAKGEAILVSKQSYYDWLRARGELSVAEQTLAVSQAHANDAKLQYGAGTVAGADVLRAESAVSASELAVERAKAKVTSTEWKLRTYIHAADEETLEPGESLDTTLPPVGDNLKAMLAEAQQKRPELKAAEKNLAAAEKLAALARAERIPALSAFGEVTYANPNARKFPTTAEFFPSWSAGAQVTWSPKKFLVAGPAAAEQENQAAAIDAQRSVTRDLITHQVVDAYTAVLAADAGLATTTRQLDNARETYRVSRQLYSAGRTTGTALIDAEFSLAQARFDYLNARVDARVARAQLDFALGRDSGGLRDR